jgi:soluble lytic murein transglycosylase-like protein
MVVAAWIVSTLAPAVGLPLGPTLLDGLAAEPRGTRVATATSTKVLVQWSPGETRERAGKARRQTASPAQRERVLERRARRRGRERRERRERRRERLERRRERREAAEPETVPEIVYAAASEFGLDGSYLLGVAQCESDLDPGAVNAAGYHGLFQFDVQTWAAYGYGSIYEPTAQARTAARLLAAGMDERWPNCA